MQCWHRHTAKFIKTSLFLSCILPQANPHPALLRVIEARGFGFECVSQAEIQHVLQVFPDISPKRILFTPNFAPKAEYEFALSQGVNVTVDNTYCLQRWPETFRGHKVAGGEDLGCGSFKSSLRFLRRSFYALIRARAGAIIRT